VSRRDLRERLAQVINLLMAPGKAGDLVPLDGEVIPPAKRGKGAAAGKTEDGEGSRDDI